MRLHKPNLVLPVAASYNVRGVDGYTNTVTNALDQRKVNSIYEVVQNAGTGKVTIYLAKRPGVIQSTSPLGATTQSPYLLIRKPGAYGISVGDNWLFSKSSNDIRVSDASSTTVIDSTSGYVPLWADITRISDVETAVVQLVHTSTSDQKVFYASAIGSWTEISDADFTALSHIGKMEHIDGYAVILTLTNYLHNSNVNSLSLWSATDRIAKQITQDVPQGLMRFKKQILAFGINSVEGFINNGNAVGSPFVSVPQLQHKVGLVTDDDPVDGTNYYATFDDHLYFVGNMGGGAQKGRSVIAYNGERYERVSTNAVDKIFADRDPCGVSHVNCFGKNAIAISLTQPYADVTQRWLMYFPDYKEWFEWTSDIYNPINTGQHFIGKVGATTADHVCRFSAGQWQDESTNYDRIHQFKLPSNGNERKFMRWFGLEQAIERSACTESIQFSDDDGVTWSSARTIDCTSNLPDIYRCGSYKQRLVRMTNSTNHERRIEKILARID
jgi:hypothetical protein